MLLHTSLLNAGLAALIVSAVPLNAVASGNTAGEKLLRRVDEAWNTRWPKALRKPGEDYLQGQEGADQCLERFMYYTIHIDSIMGPRFVKAFERCEKRHGGFKPKVSEGLDNQLQMAADNFATEVDEYAKSQRTWDDSASSPERRAELEKAVEERDKMVERKFGRRPTNAPGVKHVSDDSPKNNNPAKMSNKLFSAFSGIVGAVNRVNNKNHNLHGGLVPPSGSAMPMFSPKQLRRRTAEGTPLKGRFDRSYPVKGKTYLQTQEAADQCFERRIWRIMYNYRKLGGDFKETLKFCENIHGFTPQVSEALEKKLQEEADRYAKAWDQTEASWDEAERMYGKRPTNAPAPRQVSEDDPNDHAAKVSNNRFSAALSRFSRVVGSFNNVNTAHSSNGGFVLPGNSASSKFQPIPEPMALP
ncbi:MAG: hypothetical protein M1816_003777 [Peltula sp. TS41687]|nr:MAG: hypothetical protein M1816_003777 [Peltula sp. TS41687]